jgi:A1 cistron-splicing factor AAR2
LSSLHLGLDRLESDLILFPYGTEYDYWKSLTYSISEELLNDMIKNCHITSEVENCLNPIPYGLKSSYPKDSDPSMITKYSIDKSYLLGSILEKFSREHILAEFQFYFLLLSLWQLAEGFEGWKKWLTLFLSCDEIVPKEIYLFESFVKSFDSQIRQCPSEFFHEFFEAQSFLPILLKVR